MTPAPPTHLSSPRTLRGQRSVSSGVALLVTLYACINPVIAATLGVALPGEPFNLGIAAAAAFVLLGVAVVRAQTRPSGREKVSV